MDYWTNKETLKKKAQEHTRVMERDFAQSTKQCIADTVVYGVEALMPEEKITDSKSEICVKQSDSVKAIFDEAENCKIAVLNFASYKNPGGMFFNGSNAQEENLCHSSNLYNILKEFEDTYYEWNRNHKNRALYLDRALYTPNVVFQHDAHTRLCDVLTCAAPNFGAAQRWGKVSREENAQILKNRMWFLKRIVEHQNVEVLILGAWGTGVFKQDKEEVARLFKEVFETTTVKRIVYPIPDSTTYKKFKDILL